MTPCIRLSWPEPDAEMVARFHRSMAAAEAYIERNAPRILAALDALAERLWRDAEEARRFTVAG